jgi:hypothetical protein
MVRAVSFPLSVLLIISTVSVLPAWAAAPVPAAPQTPAVAPVALPYKLKAALTEAQSRLGELEPWQKKIFDEEVVPQYQRFIRNYRASQTHSGSAEGNLAVEIDFETLKNYLKFHAPSVMGEKDSPLLISLRPGKDCEKCLAAEPVIRQLVVARVTRRGFKPVFVTPEGAVEKSKLAGSLVLTWGLAAAEDVDSVHADEKNYEIHSVLEVQGSEKSEGKMELLDMDPFETATARLLSDAFTELGERLSQEGSADTVDGKPEVLLQVTGFRDFAQLTSWKAQLQAKLPALLVEDRSISRLQVTLAVVGEGRIGEVRRLAGEIKGLAWSSGDDESILHMEVQP